MLTLEATYPAQLRFDPITPTDIERNTALVDAILKSERDAGIVRGMFGSYDPCAIAWVLQRGCDLLLVDHRGHAITTDMRKQIRETIADYLAIPSTEKSSLSELLAHAYGFSLECAESIARTEVRIAQGHGAFIGATAVGMKVKRWLLSNDAGVCSSCAANAAQGWIEIDKPFASGAQAPLDHPHCRCDAAYLLKATG